MKVDSILISRMAGVSQATVSRAFNNPEKVSEKTRIRIMEAAESIGYKPDRNASALRRKGTGTILLLYIKKESGDYWTNIKRNYWIFAEALMSLTSYFNEKPYIFEVKAVSSILSLREKEIKDLCDGVLVFDFVSEDEAEYIKSWKIPYVLCHRSVHLARFNHSATDNKEGGRLQGSFLLSEGCRKPVYITNREDAFSHKLREEGFLEILPEAKIIELTETNSVAASLIRLIDEEGADGIAFVNDMLLVQTITLMLHVNRDIQSEYPLIGYDDSTELLVLTKKPATVQIGIGEIYRAAADALLRLIRKEEDFIALVHKPELLIPED